MKDRSAVELGFDRPIGLALDAERADDGIKAEACEIPRSLSDRVVLTPAANAPDGIDAQLHGDLAAILALSSDGEHKQKLPADDAAGSLLSVVAGKGNHRQLTLPPIAV